MAFEEALATIPEDVTYEYVDTEQYCDSVLEASGPDGLLSPGDARRLLGDHGTSWEYYKEEREDESLHPVAILNFLGYC